ncbi:MAG: hypothetical protein HQL69_15480 [Magnetococcales bacterium]|nr:hypothetical protein [Magnetococcales bacterium]
MMDQPKKRLLRTKNKETKPAKPTEPGSSVVVIRRLCFSVDGDRYQAFKSLVFRNNLTGEVALTEALDRLLSGGWEE